MLLGQVFDLDEPFVITTTIYQELLQGAASERDFEQLDEYLATQRFHHPEDPVDTHRQAALLYFRCRRAGVTIRSTIDCLIARQAIEGDLLLVQNDRDFSNMARVVPELKLA